MYQLLLNKELSDSAEQEIVWEEVGGKDITRFGTKDDPVMSKSWASSGIEECGSFCW